MPLRLLLIDDEADFCTTLADRLELRGLDVRTAFCGEKGLAAIQELPPGILLLDMRMPGLSGVEVLEHVRKVHPKLPVIIITGHCSEEDHDKAQNLGVQGYLAKPLDFEELLRVISTISG